MRKEMTVAPLGAAIALLVGAALLAVARAPRLP